MLAVVAGWVDCDVILAFEDRASGTFPLSTRGRLGRASEIERPASADERITFTIGEHDSVQLTLERYAFNGAEGDRTSLEVELGNGTLHMALAEP